MSPLELAEHRRPTIEERANKGSDTTFIDERGVDYWTAPPPPGPEMSPMGV